MNPDSTPEPAKRLFMIRLRENSRGAEVWEKAIQCKAKGWPFQFVADYTTAPVDI